MTNNKFDYIKFGLASPKKIKEWSHGEVKKSETINYRTWKPEKDGLFCERIFGPSRDWECGCGKYKRIRYKGIICERCGVEVTKSNIRRTRMGHIELASPVVHIWYFKGVPNRISLLLNLLHKRLEEIIYFAAYIVVDPKDTDLSFKQILSEKEYRRYLEKYGNNSFVALIGAEAIKYLLENLDLDKENEIIREELKKTQGQKKLRLIKRLEVVEGFRRSKNKPEWMVLEVLPVIPPDLRPMVELDGGRFATSDLNDLYRKVIDRSNRLRKFANIAPDIILQNEKRMLQEAVDALIDNSRVGVSVKGTSNRPLKSLSDMLKGKKGRFRQNLLGKRVDYSGRSVIVVGPTLKIYECGLPKDMALELFKPFVINKLIKDGIVQNYKLAKKMIDNSDKKVYDILETVISKHPVLLNRAPTLHRLGIQAFEPRLIEGKAIRLHPLVTTAFNADFDGDQMAVHVPLSQEAQAEARILMLSSNNILNPKDGDPVVTPSQDMVLGNYYLTIEKISSDEGKIFTSFEEAKLAYETDQLKLHTRIILPVSSLNKESFTEEQKNKYLITTMGKLIFNDVFPKTFVYINDLEDIGKDVIPEKHLISTGENIKETLKNRKLLEPFRKDTLEKIISKVFKKYKTTITADMLDNLKNLGFYFSTKAGITVSISDIVTIDDRKKEILDESQEKVNQITDYYKEGLITNNERHTEICKTWEEARDKITDELIDKLKTSYKDNPILMMQESGARGNKSNFSQLSGMRGLMVNPHGEIIEMPIKSSFREGLTVLEYFMSTHGARKGLTDTALKTADSGYLTRRLVDIAQDVIIREEDCMTKKGVKRETLMQKGAEIVSLKTRILGRYLAKSIIDPEDEKNILYKRNTLITEEIADNIEKLNIKTIYIRSVLVCDSEVGICQKCYGRSLSTGDEVEIGEAVGIMAAQSIGEPGTQLTMRTFHTGGVSGGDITQGLPRIQEIFEARNPKGAAILSEIDGKVIDIKYNNDTNDNEIYIKNDIDEKIYTIPHGYLLTISKGDIIKAGEQITEGVVSPKELLMLAGIDKLRDYIILEVQKVYRLQGINIEDKHIEVIIRKMLQKIKVIDVADTDLLPGTIINIKQFTEANKKAFIEGKTPAVGIPILLGITKASIETTSFLSAASFQETTKVLADAAVKGKTDHLVGLKENVIIGQLIPAGTGLSLYSNIKITTENNQN